MAQVVFTLPRSGKVWALSDDNTEVAVLRQGPYKIMITSIWDKWCATRTRPPHA